MDLCPGHDTDCCSKSKSYEKSEPLSFAFPSHLRGVALYEEADAYDQGNYWQPR